MSSKKAKCAKLLDKMTRHLLFFNNSTIFLADEVEPIMAIRPV